MYKNTTIVFLCLFFAIIATRAGAEEVETLSLKAGTHADAEEIEAFSLKGATHAGAEEIEALSLKAAIDEALKSNPEILSAKQNYEASRAKIPQELLPADPMLGYGYDEIRAGVPGLMGKPMRSYSISQNMPFPTKLILHSKIASREAKILFQAYREKERDVIARTKNAYFDTWLAESNIVVTDENYTLLKQFYSSASSRYSVGKTSQQDVLKAEVELAKVQNSLVLLEEKRQIACAKLSILMNKDPRLDIAIGKEIETPTIEASLDELSAMAKEKRPRLQAFRFAIEKGKDAYMLAWNEFLPDISGRFQQMISDGKGGKWAGTLGISVPIWFWVKQSSGVKQMKSELNMIKAEYNVMENIVLFEVKEAFAKVTSQKRLKEIFETSFVPQAEAALKASLTGYEAGQIDFLNLLDSQRMLLDIKLEYNGIIAELETSKAYLEKAVGTDL